MYPAEIPIGVMREFEEIVERHTKDHQQGLLFLTVLLVAAGFVLRSMIDNSFVFSLMVLPLMYYGVTAWFDKSYLKTDVSAEEIELSDKAHDICIGLGRQWDRPVLLSDLASIVRTALKDHRASAAARAQIISARRAREQQEFALYAKRQKKTTDN